MSARIIEQNGIRITVQFTVELTGQMRKNEHALQQSLNEAGVYGIEEVLGRHRQIAILLSSDFQ